MIGEVKTNPILGAVRLFLWDRGAMAHFDLSMTGFWRSFAAPIAMAPVYYFIVMQNVAMGEVLLADNPELTSLGVDTSGQALVVDMVAYVLSIAAFHMCGAPSGTSRFNRLYRWRIANLLVFSESGKGVPSSRPLISGSNVGSS